MPAQLSDSSKSVVEAIGNIAKHLPEELLRNVSIDFPDIIRFEPTINMTIDLAQKSKDLPFNLLPTSKLNEINGMSKQVLFSFDQLKTFSINNFSSDGTPNETYVKARADILKATKERCDDFQTCMLPIYSYLYIQTLSSQAISERTENLLVDLQKKADLELQDVKTKKEELDSIIEIARDTAAQTGVSQHALTFKEIADEHANSSLRWLTASVIFMSVTLILAFVILLLVPTFGELKDVVSIQRIIAKLVLLSFLYYGALWSAKNYRIHRHLSVLNMHKHNALRTFEAFVKAASGDDQTKSAVLLETTRSIFAPVNTGYLDNSDEEGGSNRIIEIFKSVGTNVSGK